MKYKIIVLLLCAFVLYGCDSVEDMKGMFEKQELAQTHIKKQYGWNSQLGFNFNNGVLTQVTIVFNAEEVRNETVENLESITKKVVANVFKSKPQAIFIQIASVPDKERQ